MYTIFPGYVRRDTDGMSIPFDEGNAFFLNFLDWRKENEPALPAGPTLEERAKVLLSGVDAHLNAAAQAKGYDSILSASLRAALPNSAFHAEGVAFGTWMDQVYAKCYEVLALVTAEAMPEPTREQLIALLPALNLPESKGG